MFLVLIPVHLSADFVVTAKAEACWQRSLVSRVDRSGDCHLWTGYIDPTTGYGRYRTRAANVLVHRRVFEDAHGPIPEGMEVHHRCETPACVNIEHLELLTKHAHWKVGNSPSAVRARATHCQRGHEFTPENTHVDKHFHRKCRACLRESARAAYRKKRDFRPTCPLTNA